MRAILARAFPDHGILGEEDGLQNPDAAYRWVLDPIDGTRAFITGRPTFGTLIGLLHDGVADPRHHRPAGHRRALDRPRRPAHPLYRPVRWRARAHAPAPIWPTPNSPAHRQTCSAATSQRGATLQAPSARASWGGDCYAYGLLALGQIDVIAECDPQNLGLGSPRPGHRGRRRPGVTDWSGARLDGTSDGRVLALGDPRRLRDAVERPASTPSGRVGKPRHFRQHVLRAARQRHLAVARLLDGAIGHRHQLATHAKHSTHRDHPPGGRARPCRGSGR